MIPFLTALALCYILVKIPFWVIGAARGGGGRSFIGRLVRAFIAYKTFGLIRGRRGAPPAKGHPKTSADPYESPKATASGQYMLPLNVRRQRRDPSVRQPNFPKPKVTRPRRTEAGQQLKLPLDGEWPETKPRLGRDGQYRLPLNVQRQPARQRPAPPPPNPPSQRSRTQQLRFPIDGQWPETRPVLGRDGQYRLPLDVQRVRRPEAAPAPPRPLPTSSPRSAAQLKLPADGEWPENKPRLGPDGQYQLPLQVQRARRPAAAPPTPPPESPASRPRSTQGKQPSLPLKLPKVHPPRPSTRRRGGDTR
ncbi:hypothetical protein E1288_27800 [Saccharopolyspora elongata]|uniref:Uncharacterized protein n=1 Tax=Saccharopolyspora elongata TaxID=2530387 RepID=A0A4R4YEH2_9PSEU|nr:hypothetical protein E1288_27800 [Saccharopolyspora elongata]